MSGGAAASGLYFGLSEIKRTRSYTEVARSYTE
jgi:hypothetical protein